MKIWSKPDNRAAADDVVVGNLSHMSFRVPIVVACCMLVAAAAAGLSFWLLKAHNDNATADNNKNQKVLVGELKDAVSNANEQSIIDFSSQLIDGAKLYKINDSDLGWYYIDRAGAYATLEKYKLATPDYEKAAQLNGSLQLAALQGELESRYQSGERKQLIPLLQNLIQVDKGSRSLTIGAEVAQYQQDIQLLQQGKGLSF